jgi:hypothetical protein
MATTYAAHGISLSTENVTQTEGAHAPDGARSDGDDNCPRSVAVEATYPSARHRNRRRSRPRGHDSSTFIYPRYRPKGMSWKPRYLHGKAKLLADPAVCPANRTLFAQFLAFEEYKLKRTNGLPDLDEPCCNTLYGYVVRLRNVSRWFANKPWAELTREDIKHVYDGLEDGTIRNQHGRPFKDPRAYYNKVFKSKAFRLAGKDGLAREVIEFSRTSKPPVRYVTEAAFRQIVGVAGHSRYLALLWLAWDIGENINSLLKLTAHDFVAQVDPETGAREYRVNLPAAKLKRSRQARGEITLYPETVRWLDAVLAGLGPSDLLFPMGYASAAKFLRFAVRRSRATTMPDAQPVRWKDLRSGMACHLLSHGWNREQVNARLGHTPSSDTLDAYINFLALDRAEPKRRMLTAMRPVEPEVRPVTPVPLIDGRSADAEARLAQALRDIEALRREVGALRRGPSRAAEISIRAV